MTEAEILSVRSDLAGLVISVVSVSFGMISAYIAGLWLFLREAPISLRLLAFFLLTSGLLFMAAFTWGVNDLLIGTDRAWSKLSERATEIPGFGDARSGSANRSGVRPPRCSASRATGRSASPRCGWGERRRLGPATRTGGSSSAVRSSP